MRLHSDVITRQNLEDARDHASASTDSGEVYETASLRRSRSRHHAWEVKLEGDGSVSRRRVNPGNGTGSRGYAATWEQWGHFLAFLYAIDPRMITAGGVYTSREDFESQTEGMFTYTLQGV